MFKKSLKLTIICLCLLLTPAYATEVDIGLDYISSTDESRSLVLGVTVPVFTDASISSQIRYAKHNNEVSQNQGLLRAGWDPKLTKDWSLWFYEQVGYDRPKLIQVENFMGGGPKYILHKSNTSKYSISAGYVNHYQEILDGDISNIHRLSVRVKVRQLLDTESPGPELTAILSYQPNIEDPDDYLFNGEINLSYAIQKGITLKVYLQDHYRSVSEIPQKNELLTGLKLALSF